MTGRVSYRTPLGEILSRQRKPTENVWDLFRDIRPRGAVICLREGVPLCRADWGEVPEGDLLFLTLPGGGGGGKKNVLRLVAMVAVATFAPAAGKGLAKALGFGSKLAAGLATAGITIAGGLLVNALLPPEMPRDASRGLSMEEASPTYSLQAQGNSARLGGTIPMQYGEHLMFPDFAAQPYTHFADNDQYLYMTFCLGLGEREVSEIRVEETPIWISGVLQPGFEDVQLEIVDPGDPITLFPSAVEVSGTVDNLTIPNYPTYLGPYVANSSGTVINKFEVDIVFPRGLWTANDTGGLDSASCQIQIESREIDDSGTPLTTWAVELNEVFTAATATPLRYTRAIFVSEGRYEVRVIQGGSTSTDTRTANGAEWGALRGFIVDSNTFDNTTTLAIILRANEQLTALSSRRINVIQTTKLPIWNGSTWSAPTSTKSIAWALADVCRNSTYSVGLSDSQVDLDALLALDTVWTSRGDEFNGIFDSKHGVWEALRKIARAGRAQPQMVGGVVTFTRDAEVELARGVFTPKNLRAFETNHILYDEDSPDDVIVEYFDSRTWSWRDVRCALPGSSSESPGRMSLFGVTDRDQAFREGIYQAACNAKRRVFSNFTTEMEGRLLLRGDLVLLSHDMPRWGYYGVVTARTGDEVTLSEPVEWGVGQHYVSFRLRNGEEWGPIMCSEGSSPNILDLDPSDRSAVEISSGVMIGAAIVIDLDQEPTQAIVGEGEASLKRFRVVSVVPRGTDSVDVTLVNEHEEVHTADLATPPAETDKVSPSGSPDLTVYNLRAQADPQSSPSPATINVAWDSVPVSLIGWTGASAFRSYQGRYLLQLSYDDSTWVTVYEGVSPFAQIQARAGTIYLRVAIIAHIRGAWASISGDFGPAVSKPDAVNSLSVSVTADGELSASWDHAPRASSYLVKVYIGGSYTEQVFSRTVFDNSLHLSQAEFSSYGGPYSAFKFEVTATNSVGDAAASSNTLTGETLPVAEVSWDPDLSWLYPNPTKFVARWLQIFSATGYSVSVYPNNQPSAEFVDSYAQGEVEAEYTVPNLYPRFSRYFPFVGLTVTPRGVDIDGEESPRLLGVAEDCIGIYEFDQNYLDTCPYTSNDATNSGASIVDDGDTYHEYVLELDSAGEGVELPQTLPSSYTFSAWIKPTAFSGTQSILGTTGGTDVVIQLSGSVLQVYHGATLYGYYDLASDHSAATWIWIGVRYDDSASELKLYSGPLVGAVSGVPEGRLQATWSGVASHSNPALEIGRHNGGNSFVGRIDTVLLFERALSAVEMLGLGSQ